MRSRSGPEGLRSLRRARRGGGENSQGTPSCCERDEATHLGLPYLTIRDEVVAGNRPLRQAQLVSTSSTRLRRSAWGGRRVELADGHHHGGSAHRVWRDHGVQAERIAQKLGGQNIRRRAVRDDAAIS